jgi:hypothetical protein
MKKSPVGMALMLIWEYPGVNIHAQHELGSKTNNAPKQAPHIMIDDKPIGQKGDGVGYLKFVTVLKQKPGDKSVPIAAPASYCHPQAFPSSLAEFTSNCGFCPEYLCDCDQTATLKQDPAIFSAP